MQKQDGDWKVCDFHDASDSSGGGSADPSGFPSDRPSDFPTGSDFPSSSESSICFTPNGSTPICVP